MSEPAAMISEADQPEVRRFLKVLASTIVLLTGAIVAINLLAYRVMVRPENASIVQLTAAWGRVYKPILYDREKPEVAIFGRSFTRDAFDPEEIQKIIGLSVFNHAVSGGTAYENRRFAQSAAGNESLKAVIFSLDSFIDEPGTVKVEYGFDESVLNVDADGKKNRFAWLSRPNALALAGSAVGNNIALFSTLAARAAGKNKEELLFSYEQMDFRIPPAWARTDRASIVHNISQASLPAASRLPAKADIGGLEDLDVAINAYCAKDLEVILYLTPDLMGSCRQPPPVRLNAIAYLQEKQKTCQARLHLYDFQYPNALTLEPITLPAPFSKYYRPDGHPRPTVGEVLAAVMFKRPLPTGTSAQIAADFGADLLMQPDPVAWLDRRLARCDGNWVESDLALVTGGK